jgi:predicted metal-dependent hydrolase
LNPLSERPLKYQIRRSERAKKTRIIVTTDKIEVVAPPKISDRRIQAFVSAQQNWILDALKRVRHRAQTTPSLAPAQYVEGADVPFQGQHIPLTIKLTTAKRLRVQFSEQHFVVYLPASQTENSSAQIKTALESWMKQHTRQLALQLIDKHSPKHQLFPRNLRIKTQKSRWGSCGPYNDINLNWLLLLAPPVIMEYVVIHELCHIKHKNHSQDFWKLVAAHMPDYLQHRHWLKQHGASLMRGL